MNQMAKDKLSESIILLLEEVDSTELGSNEREAAIADLCTLIHEDLEITKEDDHIQVELAKAKANGYKDVKSTVGRVTGFIADHAYEFGTLAVTMFIAGAAFNLDINGEMINPTVLKVLPKPKIK